MERSYIEVTIEKKKNIALIAHDAKKAELIQWCNDHKEILMKHDLCGTGTTARLVCEKTGLRVLAYNSGPLGGDQQIGAKIVEGEIDLVVFLSDPLTAQPHDPDVKALLRISQVYDIPIANNRSTADFIITSKFMDLPYRHTVLDYKENLRHRADFLGMYK
ncbi:methylglyoxal synthase [Proteocatella sphenisci]|uniref:methylglyoxal synthase n=1 Tax=Proteocatella sphenisci TaxID=181070 RepID=UPI0004B6380A|nr:methylglyoxal synthase [Proteocatella sphenisci]